MRFKQKEVNLHTHTLFSHHGSGMPEDYVRAASDAGNIKVLGFSEHAPVADSTFPKERMQMNELDDYVNSVRAQKDDTITILLGFECDWREDFASFYSDELLSHYGADYLLGSLHYLFTKDDGTLQYVGKPENRGLFSLIEYVEGYTAMLASGLFLYGCHPDLFASSFPVWDENTISASKDIIAAAKEYDMPLEINGNGFYKKKIVLDDGSERFPYPIEQFWTMARDEGVKIVTSSDAHKSRRVDSFALSEEFASPLGIEWAEYEIDSERGKIEIVPGLEDLRVF